MFMRRRVGWLSALSITGDDGETIGGVIDHRLSRRVVINEFRRGRLRRDQVCDAHPDLMRAARNFGDETQVRCPICQEDNVVLVTYVFGPRLPHHGRCITRPHELEEFRQLAQREAVHAQNFDSLYTAYVVEACRSCKWHHLLRSLPLMEPSSLPEHEPVRRKQSRH
jgi:hypothetical protein